MDLIGSTLFVPIRSIGGKVKTDNTQFKLRIPQELKDWLAGEAKKSFHSMQAEILGIIADAKKRKEQA
jgi:hypothetical protein